MKPLRFLPGVHPQLRAFIFMTGVLVFYCFWLWLCLSTEIMSRDTSAVMSGALLLLPLVPVGLFDLWLRLSWRQDTPTVYPPPPTLPQLLLQPEYGLFWFPVLIMVPLWIWSVGLICAIVWYSLAG